MDGDVLGQWGLKEYGAHARLWRQPFHPRLTQQLQAHVAAVHTRRNAIDRDTLNREAESLVEPAREMAGVQDYCTHASIRSGSFESQGSEEPANALSMVRPRHNSPTQIGTTLLENHRVTTAGNQLAACGLDNEIRTRELPEEVLEYLPFRGREELRYITVEDIEHTRQILCTVPPRAQVRTSSRGGSHDHGHPANVRSTFRATATISFDMNVALRKTPPNVLELIFIGLNAGTEGLPHAAGRTRPAAEAGLYRLRA